MAESSSPALPGDVEWLPGPGGTWVLRIHPSSPQPPVLILRVLGGGERRIDAGSQPVTEYAIPAELDWSAAWLQWSDGTRAALPLPHGPHAEVIELHPRRFARGESAPAPREDAWRGEISPPAREALEAASRAAERVGRPEPASASVEPAAGDEARRGTSQPVGEAQPASGGIGEPAMGDETLRGTSRPVGEAERAPGADALRGIGESATGDEARRGTSRLVGAAERAIGADALNGTGDSAAGGVSESAAGDEPLRGASPPTAGEAERAAGADVLREPSDLTSGEAELDAGVAGHSWTTPPQLSDSTREAESVWRERRDDLRRELSEAADAIARARDGERSARDAVLTALAAARADLRASRAAREADASALAAVTGELGAERAAHAVTRGSVGTLADALSAARAELAAAKTRGEATQADLDVARAELAAARATGAAELAEARSEATQARAEAASLRDALEAERGQRERPLAGRGDLGRLAREQAEAAAAARRSPEASAQLLANLDAAAAALRAAAPAADPGEDAAAYGDDDGAGLPSSAAGSGLPASGNTPPVGDEGLAAGGGLLAGRETFGLGREAAGAGLSAGREPFGSGDDAAGAGLSAGREPSGAGLPAGREPADAAPPETSLQPVDGLASTSAPPPPADAPPTSSALVAPGGDKRLRRALVALAREDGVAAGALLVGLLPAQGAVIEGTLTYDVTVRGVGTFAVFVADGSARIVRLSRRRPRAQALFHLSAEPSVLAELLAGDRGKLGRFRRKAKLSGRRKRARELLVLADAKLSLAAAVKAGARLEPGLVYRALPLAVDPEWTRGHTFTVAQQIVELAPNAWHISARDGQPLRVVQRHADAPADATVTMSLAAFERLLRNEPPVLGDRPQVRGDREAVAALKRWTDLARGA